MKQYIKKKVTVEVMFKFTGLAHNQPFKLALEASEAVPAIDLESKPISSHNDTDE